MSARGACTLHPGQSHWTDSTRGHLHSPGTLECLGSVLPTLPKQHGHFRQSASGSGRSRSSAG
eukprot:10796499-Lingulodinium_polyedra.AAC.1